jgi:hypothetical protein
MSLSGPFVGALERNSPLRAVKLLDTVYVLASPYRAGKAIGNCQLGIRLFLRDQCHHKRQSCCSSAKEADASSLVRAVNQA